jgi:mRNA interferase HigB
MQVIGWDIVESFLRDHPKAKRSLNAWRQAMEADIFRHFAELKRVVASADYVKPYTVFNISKNKYRMIAQVAYGIQAVRVVSVLTHEQYDRGSWRRT